MGFLVFIGVLVALYYIAHLDDFGKIRDANGNTVGKWSIE